VYFALHLCGMCDVTRAPVDADSLTSDDDRASHLQQLSQHIVAELHRGRAVAVVADDSNQRGAGMPCRRQLRL